MILLSRLVRRVYRSARTRFYRFISTAKVEGKFCAVSPVLCDGKGKVCVGKGVTFGFIQDADFWTSYTFLNPRNADACISFGDGTTVCNHFTAVAEGPGIEFGKNVLVGTGVSVFDSDFHEVDPAKRCSGTPKAGKVVIGDNVWIGERVTILKGTVIGENSVAAAGAVVSGIFPKNVVIGGVPAKVIRNI